MNGDASLSFWKISFSVIFCNSLRILTPQIPFSIDEILNYLKFNSTVYCHLLYLKELENGGGGEGVFNNIP